MLSRQPVALKSDHLFQKIVSLHAKFAAAAVIPQNLVKYPRTTLSGRLVPSNRPSGPSTIHRLDTLTIEVQIARGSQLSRQIYWMHVNSGVVYPFYVHDCTVFIKSITKRRAYVDERNAQLPSVSFTQTEIQHRTFIYSSSTSSSVFCSFFVFEILYRPVWKTL